MTPDVTLIISDVIYGANMMPLLSDIGQNPITHMSCVLAAKYLKCVYMVRTMHVNEHT